MPQPLGVSIFDRMLVQRQVDAQRQREDAVRAQDLEQRRWERGLAEQELAEKKTQAEFERQAKMAELRGKFSGALGMDAPQGYQNDAEQEASDVAHMGGQFQRLQADQAAQLKAERERGLMERFIGTDITRNRGLDVKHELGTGNLEARNAELAERGRHNQATEGLGWANHESTDAHRDFQHDYWAGLLDARNRAIDAQSGRGDRHKQVTAFLGELIDSEDAGINAVSRMAQGVPSRANMDKVDAQLKKRQRLAQIHSLVQAGQMDPDEALELLAGEGYLQGQGAPSVGTKPTTAEDLAKSIGQ